MLNKDIENMISSYIDGDISNENKIIFEKHMKDNPSFSYQVDKIKDIILSLNNQPKLSPSPQFLDNLEKATFNKNINQTNWFTVNFKTTLGFSFMLLFISIFFINRTSNASNDSINITDQQKTNEALIKNDTLKTNNEDFDIYQVKGNDSK